MSVQIDMTKFLESLVDDKNGFHQLTVLDILNALNSMGLTIGFNGKIERIVAEPEQVPEGWYVCKKAFGYPKLDGYLPVFVEGESTPKEKVFAAIPYMTEELFNEHFRPATEEEIKGNNGGISPKFKEGDKVYNRKLNAEGLILGTSYEDGNVTIKSDKLAPNVFPISIEGLKDWELVEPKQENSELTEFESALYGEFYGIAGFKPTAETIKMSAKELLSIARKQIAEELEKSLNMAMVIDKYKVDGYTVSVNWYQRGVNDIIKKIKGE